MGFSHHFKLRRPCRLSDQHRQRLGHHQRPNNPDDEEYIVRLVGQVARVSVETVKIVKSLPAEFTDAGGKLFIDSELRSLWVN
jgi:hypothetical protein